MLVARLRGDALRLRRPLASGGLRRLRQVPRFWRCLSRSLAGDGGIPEQRVNLWLLVLAAKKIPHRIFPGAAPRVYVPALWEGVALHEIRAVEKERPTPIFVPPVRHNVWGVLFVLLLLLIWHGLRWHWFRFSLPDPPFPADAQLWSKFFGLDVYRARSLHEWWRALTALTLHSDDSHLFSNLGFGLVFLIALCRRAGLGLGMALTLLAGVTGNIGNALTREAHFLSIGFSTALFGAVGALCALNSADIFGHQRRFAQLAGQGMVQALARRVLAPLAAGLALLGILGGGGEARTDYAAHIWGFCCGIAVTLAFLPLEKRLFALPPAGQTACQAALFAAALSATALAWLYAA